MFSKADVRLYTFSPALPLPPTLPKPTADVLGRWVGGKWVGEGKLVDSDYSKAMAVGWGDQLRVVSRPHLRGLRPEQYGRWKGDTRPFRLLLLDPEKAASSNVRDHAGWRKAAGTELTISADHNRWEYLGDAEIAGIPVQFRTVNVFRDNDHVGWQAEYSAQQGVTRPGWARCKEYTAERAAASAADPVSSPPGRAGLVRLEGARL